MTAAPRLLSALFLGVSFLASEGLRTGHRLFHGDHHHGTLTCLARYERSNTYHLHDERYSADDCWVCAFWCATPDLPSVGPSLAAIGAEVTSAIAVFLETYTAAPPQLQRSRAPPAATPALAAAKIGSLLF
ncbi:MAG: hypothetical protein RMJ33_01705 [Saprospiraceae bacterium]|nr:hypothetical protein [Saprospiraceae bacterium]MDW8228527.1 hypothetical protein [Saprospiraceae bacterium]